MKKIRYTKFLNFIKTQDLTLSSKVILQEIIAVCSSGREFFAHNKYIENLYGISKATVKRSIKELIDKGFICVEHLYKNQRKLTISEKLIELGVAQNEPGGGSKRAGGWLKMSRGVAQNEPPTVNRYSNRVFNTENPSSKLIKHVTNNKPQNPQETSFQKDMSKRRWKHGGDRPNWKDCDEAAGTPDYLEIHKIVYGDF